ncbi:hypothetical protein CHS0354_042039 [Potamilus streckersoni]|uniref:Uncharacterized protein n=1 Tax=Potamilus streckersoni TaxID=2493646 RepID=A0AAE0TAS4_9BIVA|nr:hypothetical protein CHS0354_042039 [Potamilus streckersoni]
MGVRSQKQKISESLCRHRDMMAILKRFLCFSNTRLGSLLSGIYSLVVSLVCLVYYLFRYVGYKLIEKSTEFTGIVYTGFVIYAFVIVASLILIPGVQLDKKNLLLPWIYMDIIIVLYDTGSVALLTTIQMEREKTLNEWELSWVFFYLFRLTANCYCFACVVSQYQELSDGRGTYEYLYKPIRRGRIDVAGYDLDTFDLPVGIHLPRYHEQDPNKEYSPPSYDCIYHVPKEQSDSEDFERSSCFNVDDTLSTVASGYECNYRRINPNCYQVTVDIVWI